jgi:hypothetical protein
MCVTEHCSNDKNSDLIESMFVLLLHHSRGGPRLHNGGCQWFEDLEPKNWMQKFFLLQLKRCNFATGYKNQKSLRTVDSLQHQSNEQ